MLLRGIELLVLDVDGVLTDGRIHFDAEGREYKSFHVHDAAGLVYWHRSGRRSGFLSGRGGDVVRRRATELGVHEILLERIDKEQAFAEVLARQQLTPRQVAYMGDDLLDLPVLRQVGLAATVPEARGEVAAMAHFVSSKPAGFGAARDVIELLMRAQETWANVVAKDGRA
ncbi:MAG: HAD hydrolase family protein [Planctomycetes bacterium]|nr:HAD hydrolase family protein [Planctomycetota bacterium]MCB9884458.1 HAD hydrolase family protein [Planctomycetota bacterium]